MRILKTPEGNYTIGTAETLHMLFDSHFPGNVHAKQAMQESEKQRMLWDPGRNADLDVVRISQNSRTRRNTPMYVATVPGTISLSR